MNIDEVITIEIVSVQVYGLFGKYQDYSILVRIPDTSWIASYCSCEQIASPGDFVKVKILHIDSKDKKASASIRAIYPDPWENPKKLIRNSKIEGTIIRYVKNADRCNGKPGYLVSIEPGAYAMLCDTGTKMKTGDKCWIILSDVISDKRAVEIKLA